MLRLLRGPNRTAFTSSLSRLISAQYRQSRLHWRVLQREAPCLYHGIPTLTVENAEALRVGPEQFASCSLTALTCPTDREWLVAQRQGRYQFTLAYNANIDSDFTAGSPTL
jgi:hypothetical protein